MARFCPMCGKGDSEAEFYGELCMECARLRVKPLPAVRVTVCQKCGILLDKGRKKKGIGLEEEVVRLLKLKGSGAKLDEKAGMVEYDTPCGRMRQAVEILVGKTMCADCGRAGTQYFEAIIQLRGDAAKIVRIGERLVKRIESRSFIPKIEELKEGIDIYCGSRNEAIAALNSQALGFLRTEKLAGEKNGKRLYRTTLLVRL